MTNEELYERALKAIDDLYSDTSVSIEDARANLRGLIDEIEIRIDALRAYD